METITEKTVREIAAEHPASLRVFESLGIDYCCGGGKLLGEACMRAGVDLDRALLMIERAERESQSGDPRNWNALPLCDLMMHIVDRHHTYVRQETSRIDVMLLKVTARHGAAHPELNEIEALFGALGQELATHMVKEEHVLFPHIKRTEEAAKNHSPRPQACFDSVTRPITNMVADHDDAAALLSQIRNLTNDYMAPSGVCATFRALFAALEAFERDLHEHVHLENNILFPRAIALEQAS